MTSAKKKKHKKTKKGMQTKVILEEKMDETEGDEYEAGMFLNKEEMQIIYNALSSYKPTANEEHLLSVLLEEFEEILMVDYNEAYPDVN